MNLAITFTYSPSVKIKFIYVVLTSITFMTQPSTSFYSVAAQLSHLI